MSLLIGKLKEYVLHFFISCLIILGIAGMIKYHNDVRNLNEQIYLVSKSHNSLVVSAPVKKTIIQKILDKKQLPVSPDVPTDTISKVVEVQTSTDCPNIDVTVLKDGTVVSNSPGVRKIIVENYENKLYNNKLDLRVAAMAYPRVGTHKADWDLGLQVSYWHVWRLAPEFAIAQDFVGGGIAYNPGIKHFENLDFSGGYGYRFDHSYTTPYGAVSLRFGK